MGQVKDDVEVNAEVTNAVVTDNDVTSEPATEAKVPENEAAL